jgi:hypothetical protein
MPGPELKNLIVYLFIVFERGTRKWPRFFMVKVEFSFYARRQERHLYATVPEIQKTPLIVSIKRVEKATIMAMY